MANVSWRRLVGGGERRWAALGLAVVIELERGVERRKVRRWVWGMVAGFVVLLTIGLVLS